MTETANPLPLVVGGPAERLVQMSRLYVLSRAIHAIAQLGVANRVAETPVSIADLARPEALHAPFLARLMAYLASYGIFEETSPGYFRATEISLLMRDDHPRSLAPVLRLVTTEWWNAAGQLADVVRSGKSGIELLYGERFFEFLSKRPALQRGFDEGMARFSRAEDEPLARAYDFSSARVVAELAGGKGNFLREILKNNPHVEGILFERPVALSGSTLLDDFVRAGRARLVPGNLFEVLPRPADVYVLKGTLHDFDDEDAVAILKNCARTMGKSDRLLLIEQLLPAGRSPHPHKTTDMAMMFLLGGAQRTAEQWQDLLDRSGLRLVRSIATGTSYTCLEALSPRGA
jgi:C-methyltransferase